VFAKSDDKGFMVKEPWFMSEKNYGCDPIYLF